MAYTQYGGDLLEIEALKFEGNGKIQITGSLGDVMKESARASLSYARSIAKTLKIDAKKFNKFDFHIHVPEGATPKDGPSAGVALSVCLVSVLGEYKIHRDIAMTGEITLSGKVLEIGGLKEKLLAALRGGIKKVLIPQANVKDLEDMPKEVLDNLKIIPITTIDEALKECLIIKNSENSTTKTIKKSVKK
jgi:ATP-dependent Lon protease